MIDLYSTNSNERKRDQSRRSEHSVTGGDPASVVFSAPLNGGSSDEWVSWLAELRDRFENVPFLQLDRQRCRHRVSPKTAPARSAITCPLLTEWLRDEVAGTSMLYEEPCKDLGHRKTERFDHCEMKPLRM